ncbi:hypothetical protein [Piscinibacter gummiphilus]|uniref:Zeta toxin domain-containing protein n=1 Tax=Piscinibacter gummiphilus TaxID=946333 RepID=A0ABZ0CNL3_9BURK|nr:hypothetical protein [Piscinibacter gummiphilus]WOB06560.1 hypothetical protein RXV79_16700 [Piscinibacter gummiphilus]
MDHFGIGAAMKGMALAYFQAARQSGRTTSMIESMRDGDRAVFVDSRQADIVRRRAKEMGRNIECIVVEPKQPREQLERLKPAPGRTIFDHVWVEAFYLGELQRSTHFIDEAQRMLSTEPDRPNSRHLELQLVKWRI